MSLESNSAKLSFLPHPDALSVLKQDPFINTLSEIKELVPLSDGVAHYVYRLKVDDKFFFLKIRGSHFPKLPDISINPDDIKNEYKALTIYGSLLPDNFPQVISFNSKGHYLIISDATFNGELFQETLLRGDVTREMVFNLGKTLKKIHASITEYTEDLRDEGDGAHYDNKLLHRFGFAKNNGLEEMVEKLKRGKKQLILGDPAPKNIGVNNNGSLFVFFDLEDVHQGNPVFDYGYLLGHIILHSCLTPEKALDLIDGYADGYGESSYDEDTVKKIALGTIRYRLAGKIPYPDHNIPSDLRSPILNRIESALQADLKGIDWSTLLNYIAA